MEEAPAGLLLVPDSRYREEAARIVREAAVDGFIIYSTPRNDPRIEAALARRLPIVTVDQPRGAQTPFVGIDDRRRAALGASRVGPSASACSPS
jgi:DNA-binding LacI/PurR family transcriptional regulator